MTFVGKILVIVIMVFALFFLALSTVVFTTSANWKEEVKKQKELVGKAQTDLNTVRTDLEARKKDLEVATEETKKQTDLLKARIAQLEDEAKRAGQQLTEQIKNVEEAQNVARAAQAQAEDRQKETEKLRELLAEVQKQANEYKLRQTELNDEIRNLTRDVDVAQNNNRDLRDRVAALSAQVRTLGATPSYNLPQGAASLPGTDVEGVVLRVDEKNQRAEISIGTDDGVAVGNELDVYQLNPPQYIGKVRVEVASADNAVARVVGRTYQGRKMKEGDIVSTKIRPQ